MNVAIVAGGARPGPDPTADEVADGRRRLAAIAETAAAVDGPITRRPAAGAARRPRRRRPRRSATRCAPSLAGDEVLAAPGRRPRPVVGRRHRRPGRRSPASCARARTSSARRCPTARRERSAWLAPTAISTGAATMLRDLGFRSLVFTRTSTTGSRAASAGTTTPTLGVEVDLGDGATLPGDGRSTPAARLLDPGALDRRHQRRPTPRCRSWPSLVTTRRELGDDLRRSAVLAARRAGIPDAEVAGDAGDVRRRDARLRARPAVGAPERHRHDDRRGRRSAGRHAARRPPAPTSRDRAGRIDLTRVSAESAGSMMLDDTQLARVARRARHAAVDRRRRRRGRRRAGAGLGRGRGRPRQRRRAPRRSRSRSPAASSPLRLNLRNNGDEPLQVVVRPSSPKLTFPAGDQLVTLAPDGVTEVVIPVEARSNGTSSLEIAVLTPVFGQEVAGPDRAHGPRQRPDRPRPGRHRRRRPRAAVVVVRALPPAPAPAPGAARRGRRPPPWPRDVGPVSPDAAEAASTPSTSRPTSATRDR